MSSPTPVTPRLKWFDDAVFPVFASSKVPILAYLAQDFLHIQYNSYPILCRCPKSYGQSKLGQPMVPMAAMAAYAQDTVRQAMKERERATVVVERARLTIMHFQSVWRGNQKRGPKLVSGMRCQPRLLWGHKLPPCGPVSRACVVEKPVGHHYQVHHHLLQAGLVCRRRSMANARESCGMGGASQPLAKSFKGILLILGGSHKKPRVWATHAHVDFAQQEIDEVRLAARRGRGKTASIPGS